FNLQLIIAARLVQRYIDPEFEFFARLGYEPDRLGPTTEHDGAHGGTFVLYREIPMAGRSLGKVGNLAAHPDAREIALEQRSHATIQLAYRPYALACWQYPVRIHAKYPIYCFFPQRKSSCQINEISTQFEPQVK